MYDFNAAGDKMMDCWFVDDVRQIGLEVCTQALILQAERDELARLINSQASKPIEQCKHYKECYKKAYDALKPLQCPICQKWEWAGPTQEIQSEPC